MQRAKYFLAFIILKPRTHSSRADHKLFRAGAADAGEPLNADHDLSLVKIFNAPTISKDETRTAIQTGAKIIAAA